MTEDKIRKKPENRKLYFVLSRSHSLQAKLSIQYGISLQEMY
jgi:hypothetical protein